jgi:hypothetical protein
MDFMGLINILLEQLKDELEKKAMDHLPLIAIFVIYVTKFVLDYFSTPF